MVQAEQAMLSYGTVGGAPRRQVQEAFNLRAVVSFGAPSSIVLAFHPSCSLATKSLYLPLSMYFAVVHSALRTSPAFLPFLLFSMHTCACAPEKVNELKSA
jgi:hypothetical protein